MAAHSVNAVSTTKKLLAAGGLVLGVIGLGLFAGPGIAMADGHTVENPDATFGSADVDNAYGVDWIPAVQTYVTSSYPAASSYPAGSSATRVRTSPPATSSSAGGSYPGVGWGVADN